MQSVVTVDGLLEFDLTELKSLQLGRFTAADSVFPLLGSCHRLEFLHAPTKPDWFTDRGMIAIAKLSTLKSLSLGDLHSVTEEGMSALTKLKNLEALAFRTGSKPGHFEVIQQTAFAPRH